MSESRHERKKIEVDPYAVGWAVLGVAGIGYEITMAAQRHPERTLSAYVRVALGLSPRRRWAPGGAAVLVVGLVWLGVHLGFGILPRN